MYRVLQLDCTNSVKTVCHFILILAYFITLSLYYFASINDLLIIKIMMKKIMIFNSSIYTKSKRKFQISPSYEVCNECCNHTDSIIIH